MLHIIHKINRMWYKGGQTNCKKMSTISIAPKQSRKERRMVKEVAVLQERQTSILPATTFKRIVTQEAAKHSTETLRFNSDAVKALQAASEQELTSIFSGAAFVAEIAKRDTITVADMRNFQCLRSL
jgi:histone H3/H4